VNAGCSDELLNLARIHDFLCNRAYVFDAVDVAQLFNAGVASDSGSSVH
jgi:hypothetical protein